MITSIARTYWKICFTVHPSMFKWSTEYMIESYCPVMMSDKRKGKCSWAQCVNTSVVINLELTCHTWDLSGKLSEIIDTTASADPFFPISKLVNVSCSEMSLEPLFYVIFFGGEIKCFRVIFLSLMVLASQGHSPPGIVLLQHISMQCNIEIETIETITI